jgi:hypothetical protein
MYVKEPGEYSPWKTTSIKDINGDTINNSGNYDTDYYSDVGLNTSVIIYPDKQPISNELGARKLKAGDVIKFEVHAKAVDGNNEDLWSYDPPNTSNGRWSQEWTIQNAGVMRVKVNTGTVAKPSYDWKEGVVWVKVNKGTAAKPNIQWVEADLVKTKVKTGGTAANPTYGWKDSG